MRQDLEPVVAWAEEALLTSLVLNLLDNALKASALKGHGQQIDVSLKRKHDKAIIKMRDYGTGIPEEQMEHVKAVSLILPIPDTRPAGRINREICVDARFDGIKL